MRIILATPFENRLAKRGTRFIDIANLLAVKGAEVHYFTTDFSHAYKSHFSEALIEKDSVGQLYKTYYLHTFGYRKNISFKRIWSNFSMSHSFYKALSRFVIEGDIIMIPSRPVDFIYFISLLKKRKSGITLVMDIRDVWPDSFKKKNIFFSTYCNFFLKRSVRYFDRFFHISPSFTKWLVRYKPDASSLFVPPGFNRERWSQSVPKCLTYLYPMKIVFVGSLQYQLDILPFVKAIGNDFNYILGIIGEEGNGQRYLEVKRYIETNRIKNVVFHGVVEPERVPEILKEYNMGLIPMISSSMTNKLFDYIAAYLPIFVLGENDTADFVKKNNIGWISSFKVREIKETLDNITLQDMTTKASNLLAIRKSFSRELLYTNIAKVIFSIQNE